MIQRLCQFGREFLRREDGTALPELVMALPCVIFVFFACFETGLAMTRSVLLERSVDIVMRELRLGAYPDPNHALLKAEICAQTMLMPNCTGQIAIEILPISRQTWAMPTDDAPCVDRVQEIDPVTTLTIGQQNAIMLVRVCVIQDAIFPFTGVAMGMKVDDTGYRVVAVSTFVNEPG